MRTKKFKYFSVLLFFAVFLLGARNFLKTWQIENDAVIGSLNLPAESKLNDILSGFDSEMNVPFKIYPSLPADSKINISSNLVEKGDGSAQTTAPSDDLINVFPDSTIDYQTGLTTGGTFRRDGGTWNLDTCTVGRFKRQVFSYVSSANVIDTTSSAESITEGGLENPGAIFARIEGTPIGYIDLECTSASGFQKTIGSATNVIEGKVGANSRIFRFGSGSGGGAGEIADFKIQSITDPTATIKKGSIKLSDGKILTTYSGTGTDSSSYGVDLTLDLDVILGSDPVDATSYLLAIDLDACCQLVSRTQVSDTLQYVYPIEQSDFVLLAGEDADSVNRARYAPIGYIKSATTGTVWSGTGSSFSTMPIKSISDPSIFASPYVMNQTRSVGTVGSVANDYGPLADTDFPNTTNLAYYHLNNDGNTESASGGNLVSSGDAVVFGSSGLFNWENIAILSGGGHLVSTDSFYSWGDVDTTVINTFYKSDWTNITSPEEILMSGNISATDRVWHITLSLDGDITLYFSSTGTTLTDNIIITNTSGLKEFVDIGFTYEAATNTVKTYVNGSNKTTTVLSGAMRTPSATYFSVGGFGNLDSIRFVGKAQQAVVHKFLYTDAQMNALYSKRFTNHRQIAGGHILTNDSFPLTDLTGKIAYWNLNDVNDDSGNGKTLTNTGGVTFDGLDIYGETNVANFDGTAKYLTIADEVFFQPDSEFTIGGLVNIKDSVATSGIVGKYVSAGNQKSYLIYNIGREVLFITSADGSTTQQIQYTLPSDGIFHVAGLMDGFDRKLYVNGVEVTKNTFATNTIFDSTAPFEIGNLNSLYFNGTIENVFYSRIALSPEDIFKLASAKLDLVNAVEPTDQSYVDTLWEREDGKLINHEKTDWVVDQRRDHIYVRPVKGANKLHVKLKDTGMTGVKASPESFNAVYTATPPTVIPHGLGQEPISWGVKYRGQNYAGYSNMRKDICDVNDTNFQCDWGKLAVIDATNEVEIWATVIPGDAVVQVATATRGGTLSDGTQSIGGDKEFVGAIKPTGGFDTTGDVGLASDIVSGLITREFDSGVLDMPTISWNGTTPTSLTSAKYRWTRTGPLVTVSWKADYGSAGANNSSATWVLPASMPTPTYVYDGVGAEYMSYVGSGTLSTSLSSTGTPALALIFTNGSTYTLYTNTQTTISASSFKGTIHYFTND